MKIAIINGEKAHGTVADIACKEELSMPLSKKRSITYLLLISAALLFAYSLRFVFHPMTEDSLLAIFMMTLR